MQWRGGERVFQARGTAGKGHDSGKGRENCLAGMLGVWSRVLGKESLWQIFRGLGFQAKEIWLQIAVTWELLIWTTRAQKEETTCLELLMFREQIRQGEEREPV